MPPARARAGCVPLAPQRAGHRRQPRFADCSVSFPYFATCSSKFLKRNPSPNPATRTRLRVCFTPERLGDGPPALPPCPRGRGVPPSPLSPRRSDGCCHARAAAMIPPGASPHHAAVPHLALRGGKRRFPQPRRGSARGRSPPTGSPRRGRAPRGRAEAGPGAAARPPASRAERSGAQGPRGSGRPAAAAADGAERRRRRPAAAACPVEAPGKELRMRLPWKAKMVTGSPPPSRPRGEGSALRRGARLRCGTEPGRVRAGCGAFVRLLARGARDRPGTCAVRGGGTSRSFLSRPLLVASFKASALQSFCGWK